MPSSPLRRDSSGEGGVFSFSGGGGGRSGALSRGSGEPLCAFSGGKGSSTRVRSPVLPL